MAGSAVLEDVRAEDFLEYFLFPQHEDMNEALNQLNKEVSLFTHNYIWHKDPFHLHVKQSGKHVSFYDTYILQCTVFKYVQYAWR